MHACIMLTYYANVVVVVVVCEMLVLYIRAVRVADGYI